MVMRNLLLFALFILFSSDVLANSFRCGRKVVMSGDSANALLKKCGSPVRKYSSKEMVSDKGHRSSVSVSNWVYERDGKKDMIVSVHSGAVVKMQVE